MKEIISIFPKGRKERKKQLMDWLLNDVMDEDARVQPAYMLYKWTEERR